MQTEPAAMLDLLYSSAPSLPDQDREPAWNGKHYRLEGMAPGECRIYRVTPARREGQLDSAHTGG